MMIASAIVPLLLTSAAVAVPLSAVGQDQVVQVRLDENGAYRPGHDAQIDVQSEYDGFLLVLQVDPQGRLRVLFPLEPFDDASVEGGKSYQLVDRGGRGAFYVGDEGGIGTVFAAHSDWPFHVSGFAKDHRWDYQALWISPEVDVERALVDLMAKMSYDGWFEYDLVEYEVYGQDSYASSGPAYRIYPEPCCGTTVGVSVYLGPDYYPYGYPWYFSSYWYYPSYPYYRPYYGYAYYPYYRGRYGSGGHYAGGYPRGRDYQFKPPNRYDRDRSSNPYRPRVGVDVGRNGFGGGSVDYRRRRSPSETPAVSPRRRTVTQVATTGGSSTGLTRPSGRVASPRAGLSPREPSRTPSAGRTPSNPSGRVASPRADLSPREPSRTPSAGRTPSNPSGRVASPRPGLSPREPSRTPSAGRTPRKTVDNPVLRSAGRTRSQPGGRTGVPARRTATGSRTATPTQPGPKTLGRPVLKRSQPRADRRTPSRPANGRSGRSASSGRTPTPGASRPSAQRPSARASRPAAPSRPQARSGGGSRQSSGARASTPARARSGGSRRKP